MFLHRLQNGSSSTWYNGRSRLGCNTREQLEEKRWVAFGKGVLLSCRGHFQPTFTFSFFFFSGTFPLCPLFHHLHGPPSPTCLFVFSFSNALWGHLLFCQAFCRHLGASNLLKVFYIVTIYAGSN